MLTDTSSGARERTKFGLVLFTDGFGRDVSSGEVLGWALRYAEEAQRSGWDEVWTTEHHFTPVVQNPSALTMAGFLLGRTELGVGTAVCVLPNHHPLMLAEQAALLHHLGNGRFTLGVGRGQPLVDLEVLGTGLAGYRDVEESLSLLDQAVRHGRAEGNGPRYRFDEVTLFPELPESQVPVVSAASSQSVRMAARQGLPVMLSPFTSLEDKHALLVEHATVAVEHGHRVSPRDNIDTTYFAVDDDTHVAQRNLVEGLTDFLLRSGRQLRPLVEQPEPTPEQARETAVRVVEHHVAGAPSVCREQLEERRELLDVGRILLVPEGVGSPEATLRAITRAGREVF